MNRIATLAVTLRHPGRHPLGTQTVGQHPPRLPGRVRSHLRVTQIIQI